MPRPVRLPVTPQPVAIQLPLGLALGIDRPRRRRVKAVPDPWLPVAVAVRERAA